MNESRTKRNYDYDEDEWNQEQDNDVSCIDFDESDDNEEDSHNDKDILDGVDHDNYAVYLPARYGNDDRVN